jgi:hypothetical protein
MEDAVYICGWRKTSNGVQLWTTSTPTVKVEGESYAAAEERLLQAIWDRGGAMRAVLEFQPPLPKSELEAKYGSPELYLICADDRFELQIPPHPPFETEQVRETRFKWLDKYFERPVCRKCSGAYSPRSGEPLHLTYATREYDGAFGEIGGTTAQIVSSEFLSLLNDEERQRLIFRPVQWKSQRRRFYELIGPAGPPFVSVSGLAVDGWKCSGCGRSTWGYWIKGFSIHSFISRSELSEPMLGIFTVGSLPEVHLCATAPRWRELIGKKGVRGFVSQPLGVAPEHEAVFNPELPTLDGASNRT